jgi:hypothetical protein
MSVRVGTSYEVKLIHLAAREQCLLCFSIVIQTIKSSVSLDWYASENLCYILQYFCVFVGEELITVIFAKIIVNTYSRDKHKLRGS